MGRGPDCRSIGDWTDFLVHTEHTSWTLFNQTVCALRFLYRVVLSRDELARFFGAIANLEHRTILMTTDATGLGLSEALGLAAGLRDGAVQMGENPVDHSGLGISILLGNGVSRDVNRLLRDLQGHVRVTAQLPGNGGQPFSWIPRQTRA